MSDLQLDYEDIPPRPDVPEDADRFGEVTSWRDEYGNRFFLYDSGSLSVRVRNPDGSVQGVRNPYGELAGQPLSEEMTLYWRDGGFQVESPRGVIARVERQRCSIDVDENQIRIQPSGTDTSTEWVRIKSEEDGRIEISANREDGSHAFIRSSGAVIGGEGGMSLANPEDVAAFAADILNDMGVQLNGEAVEPDDVRNLLAERQHITCPRR